MKDCQFGVSPVNYSDSDSDSDETIEAIPHWNSRGEELILLGFTISEVSGEQRFVRCPRSNVWSRGQVLVFVKRHCTGVNLVEEGWFKHIYSFKHRAISIITTFVCVRGFERKLQVAYRVHLLRRRLRKPAPYGPPMMTTQGARPAYRRCYLHFSIHHLQVHLAVVLCTFSTCAI